MGNEQFDKQETPRCAALNKSPDRAYWPKWAALAEQLERELADTTRMHAELQREVERLSALVFTPSAVASRSNAMLGVPDGTIGAPVMPSHVLRRERCSCVTMGYPKCNLCDENGYIVTPSATLRSEPYGYLWYTKHMERRFTHELPKEGMVGEATPVYLAP